MSPPTHFRIPTPAEGTGPGVSRPVGLALGFIVQTLQRFGRGGGGGGRGGTVLPPLPICIV